MYQNAKDFVGAEIDRRSTAAGAQIGATAAHLRTIADQLRGDDLGRPAADYVDQGAAALESAGRYLEQSTSDQLLSDAQNFGRERPWAVAAAGFVVGLAASRMLKAGGGQERYGAPTPRDAGAPSYGTSAAPGTPVSSDAAPLEARNNAGGAAR